jgi:2-hydroxychromene-2-carboxylate isomerase
MSAIDFYFDFSSPYGYFAAEQIDALAARFGRQVNWHPILLGVVFKATGGGPPVANPSKWAYAVNDFARSARFYGLPYQLPAKFPIASQQPSRAFYWLQAQDPQAAKQLALALYRAYFVAGQDISELEVTLDVAAAHGLDRAALAEAIGSAEIKAKLKDETEAAIAKQVFGSPFVIVDGEAFFGADRLPQIEQWLSSHNQ